MRVRRLRRLPIYSVSQLLALIGQVSVPLGRTKHESMGSAITSRSLDEASSRKAVGRFAQEGLVMWLATAKGMETDGLSGEIHVAADESMRPKGVDPEGTTEQADGADLRTAADEDDRSRRMGLQVGPPGGREWLSRRRRLDPGGYARAVGVDIAPGTLVESSERRMVEANPHLGLPAAVEVFDGGLESTLLRRREDRRDPELQAGPHDAAQRILSVVAPLENGVVVELGIGGQPEGAPVLHERLHDGSGGHQWLRPRAVERLTSCARATDRIESPARTAATILRRFSSRRRSPFYSSRPTSDVFLQA